MKKYLIILFCIFLMCGCSANNSSDKKADDSKMTINEIINNNNYIVVDVRTKEEYNESHVKDSINIPYDEIDEKVSLDKSKTILVYCKSGKRSNIAFNTLKNLGYDVYDLGAYDNVTLEKE